jgi:hypothetical protein
VLGTQYYPFEDDPNRLTYLDDTQYRPNVGEDIDNVVAYDYINSIRYGKAKN